MHFSKAFILASACLVPMVTASCFTTGEIWDNKDNAKSKVGKICSNISGDYAAGVTRRRCRNGNGQKYDFTVRKTSTGGGFLTRALCVASLTSEINGCDRGGRSEKSGFLFTSDPNLGSC